MRYRDGDNIRRALLDDEAEHMGRLLTDMKSSQLRRYYDEVKAVERRILLAGDEREQERAFQRELPMLGMLKANAAYGAQRGGIVPPEFLQFVVDHVAAVKTLNDLRAFIKHFEAVVAFHKFYARD